LVRELFLRSAAMDGGRLANNLLFD